jgi:hypothetical protein
MTRFSLQNYFHPITYPQFIEYTKEFAASIEEAHGGKCSVSVSGMSIPKSCADTMDDAAKEVARERLSHGCYDATVGEEAWNAAHDVEVFIASADDQKNLASIDFKGRFEKSATFFVDIPGADDVRKDMQRHHPHAIRGHGYKSHTDGTQWKLAY